MKILSLIITIIIAALAFSGLDLWYKTYILGHYYEHATLFRNVILCFVPIIIVSAAFAIIQLTWKNLK